MTGAVPRLKQQEYVTRGKHELVPLLGVEETGKEKELFIAFSPGDFVVGKLNFPKRWPVIRTGGAHDLRVALRVLLSLSGSLVLRLLLTQKNEIVAAASLGL
jgi:hypothetical protein